MMKIIKAAAFLALILACIAPRPAQAASTPPGCPYLSYTICYPQSVLVRPPSPTDDLNDGFVSGLSLWRWPAYNQVYLDADNTAGTASWIPVNPTSYPLPGDAASITPSVAYGTAHIVKAYAGPLVHINKPSDPTGIDIGYFPGTGGFDWVTFSTYAPNAGMAVFNGSISGTMLTVNSVASGTLAKDQLLTGSGLPANFYITALGTGTGGVGNYTVSASASISSETINAWPQPVGVTKWYDQEGGGASGDITFGDGTHTAFANEPSLSASNKCGTNPSVFTGNNSSTQFMTYPTAVSLNKNNLSAAWMGRVTDRLTAYTNLFTIGNSAGSDALQIISYGMHGINIAFGFNGSAFPTNYPTSVILTAPASGSVKVNYGQAAAITQNAFSSSVLTGGSLGNQPTAVSGASVVGFGGEEYCTFALYPGILTQNDSTAIQAAQSQVFSTYPQTQALIAVDGESNTEGFGIYGYYAFIRQLADQLEGKALLSNAAASGETVATMLSEYSVVQAPLYSASRRTNIYLLWPGANDIWTGGQTAAQVMPNILSLVALAKATGYTVVVATEPDRAGTGAEVTQKDLLSAAIIANAGTAGYIVAPISANPLIGADGQSATNYFADGAHFSDTGASIAAGIIYQTIYPLLIPGSLQ